jgi:NAD(P)-dependent dehydrogenase (short-subunit alcohol dehydrogenase family)
MPKTFEISRRRLMMGASVTAAAYAASACSEAPSAAVPAPSKGTDSGASKASAKAERPSKPLADAKDLSGLSILITGCSSGFGRLGAEHYARLGAKVFATMRNLPRPEATELKALALKDGLDITVLEIDITKDDQVQAGVQAAIAAAGGKLDVLINNAGMSIAGPIEAQDMEATQLIFDTNVYGAHRMARAALPSMRANGSGYIFNVSSQLGRVIIPGFGQYSPTKFALEAMSEQLAYEVASHGVDVTLIQPGGYPTKIWYNQNIPSAALKARLSSDMLSAYPQLTAGMGKREAGGGEADPMDIPRAIAAAIAAKKEDRPLRIALHPIARPQEAINKVSAKMQLAVLGDSPFGPIVKSVLD